MEANDAAPHWAALLLDTIYPVTREHAANVIRKAMAGAASAERERMQAEIDKWRSRAVGLYMQLPDATTVGDIKRDTAAALAALQPTE